MVDDSGGGWSVRFDTLLVKMDYTPSPRIYLLYSTEYYCTAAIGELFYRISYHLDLCGPVGKEWRHVA
jgi:hypothetical protein